MAGRYDSTGSRKLVLDRPCFYSCSCCLALLSFGSACFFRSWMGSGVVAYVEYRHCLCLLSFLVVPVIVLGIFCRLSCILQFLYIVSLLVLYHSH